MEALIAGLGIAAGAGWGVALGLAVALWVALSIVRRGPPPAGSYQQPVEGDEYSDIVPYRRAS